MSQTVESLPAPESVKTGGPMAAQAGDSAAEGDSLFFWVGSIEGAAGTVYAGMRFKMSLRFPANYPFVAPLVRFESPCFHPNVDTAGNICLDILKENWSAAYSVRTILLSIQSLLGEPNNASPLNAQAASLWNDQERYAATLKQSYQEDC